MLGVDVDADETRTRVRCSECRDGIAEPRTKLTIVEVIACGRRTAGERRSRTQHGGIELRAELPHIRDVGDVSLVRFFALHGIARFGG
jgi:hypothetical protein